MAMSLKRWMRQQLFHVPLIKSLFKRQQVLQQFEPERALLAGSHYAASTHRSILHFSVHKSATQYVKSILRRCALENGLLHVQMTEFSFFQTGMPCLHELSAEEMEKYRHVFHPRGYLYSVFAGMVEGIPQLDNYHLVLMIRDPRDALTSEYYSVAYSYQPPTARDKYKTFMQRRVKALEHGIDFYVLSESERFRRTYQRYLDALVPRRNVHITKYETMLADFPAWLDALLQFCELPISPHLRQELLAEAEASYPRKEDVTRHIRQVAAGDHRRKLKPETIGRLNISFANVLRGFGYGQSAENYEDSDISRWNSLC